MGLFDLAGPALSAADALIQFLPAFARLLLWACLTGILSMLCYWLFSAQGKVGAAKDAAISARKALNSYEGHEFSEMWPLVGATLRTSLKHFWVVLGPALLGSLPALAVIVWVSNQFGYSLPKPGQPLTLWSDPAIALTMGDEKTKIKEEKYIVRYPSSSNLLPIYGFAEQPALTALPLAAAVPVVHKRLWWNSLIGNLAGYLPEGAPVDAIHFELERQVFLNIGPGWMRTWELPYFLTLILCSLGIKFAFRID